MRAASCLGVAAAADGFVAFQGAADVVGREDDGPAAVDLDAFELRLDLADAGGDGLAVVGRLAGRGARPGGCRSRRRRW